MDNIHTQQSVGFVLSPFSYIIFSGIKNGISMVFRGILGGRLVLFGSLSGPCGASRGAQLLAGGARLGAGRPAPHLAAAAGGGPGHLGRAQSSEESTRRNKWDVV